MTEKELEKKLHNQIPMTKLMELTIVSINNNKLITKAPLAININDKGTAFGGSLNTINIISSWSLCFLLSQQFKIEHSSIVIFKNETKFLRPVTKDINCHTFMPSSDELYALEEKIKSKKSGSIKIYSQIIENEKVCVDFVGTYVIKDIS